MKFFGRIISLFRKKKPMGSVSKELADLYRLDDSLTPFLQADHYVARSEYRQIRQENEALVRWFRVLKDSGTLETYCRKCGAQPEEAERILSAFENLTSLVDAQNERFVQMRLESEKEYLDSILTACDPAIRLDESQRRVVLCDEDYMLVVAGAGAGKTTTVAAKVKYLVEKQGIDPKQILVISFTNKAVNELKERIIGELHIDCPIATFHSTGNALLRIHNPERLNIVGESFLYVTVRDYLRGSVLTKESMVNNLILFFASYFDAPFEGKELNDFFSHIARSSFTTMRSELDEYERQITDIRSQKKVTIQNEVLRSHQEVEIANFLYLNSIEYTYEPLYRHEIAFARKPYTPDFLLCQGENEVYLEHFGISQDGKNSRFSKEEQEAYKKAVNQKVLVHRQHGTRLIYTFSAYRDARPLTEHLKEELEAAGFVLKPRSRREILEKLVHAEGNRYIRKLVLLICRFITNFKTNGYTLEDFDRMSHETANVRSRLFLEICCDCYLEYERRLKEENAVDFQDMINESARILRTVQEMGNKLDFKYVIVDEYQDISRQRFDLVTALSRVTDAKIMAVGDDWQSIYAFSGSDISLFTKFAEKMGYAKLLKIVRTYRNSQEVIDIAGNFIQKNKAQIEKDLVSPKHITDPVIIYTYDSRYRAPGGDGRSGANYALSHAVETALGQILEYEKEEQKPPGRPKKMKILLLGRFGFDGDHLERSGLFEYLRYGNRLRSRKYPHLDISFMTTHSSKGLGYDNVIIVNGKNETYGFPSKIEDDPVLSFVVKQDRSMEYAEERRLFYVAMTRTKNRVYFVAPQENPSEFLLELKRDYKNVVLKGSWNDDPNQLPDFRKTCPFCGYPLQYRYKEAYGLRLYLCTNEPEVCSFMTNSYQAGSKLSILKCDWCRDGYLVVTRRRDGGRFLGCTNYKKNRTGCNRTLSPEAYERMMAARGVVYRNALIESAGTDSSKMTYNNV